MKWCAPLLLLAGCTAATPPYRGPGPAPQNAADRELLRLVELYLDLSARIDPFLGDAGGPTRWLERWPDRTPDGLTERARIAKQTRRDLLPIDASLFSAPYRIDRQRLLREIERDLAFVDRARVQGFGAAELSAEIAAAFDGLFAVTSTADERRRFEVVVLRLERLPGHVAAIGPAFDRNATAATRAALARLTAIDVGRRLEDRMPADPALADRARRAWSKAQVALQELRRHLEKAGRSEVRDFRAGAEVIRRQLALAGETSTAALHRRALVAITERPEPLDIELPPVETVRAIAAAGPDVTLLRRARPYRPLIDAWPAVRAALDKHADRSAYTLLAAKAMIDLETHTSTTSGGGSIAPSSADRIEQGAIERLMELSRIDRALAAEMISEIIERPGDAAETWLTAERLLPIVREKKDKIKRIFAGGLLPPDLIVH